ncbi:MAG: L,D-transpeptidase family protein [Chitinophagales bacterium]|nr:L,D-transpeptidase family protein [Chitinophagaceae bacterium]MCB9065286.1 L,D-transpeptidase family protein [Chitinophagales bacterium]
MKRLFIVIIVLGILSVPVAIGYNRMVHMEEMPENEMEEAVEMTSIDSLVVLKSKREIRAYLSGRYLKTYKVALGDAPVGHKQFEGDEKTPEGLYRINDRNPNSSYHKNLGISYPNAKDKAYAKSKGKSPGGDIKIHGLPNGQGYLGKLHLATDWTNGCIAVTDEEIDELFKFVKIGSPIQILP